MAIKIIKQGELPEEKIYETTCKVCSTVFSFQRKDATKEDRGGTRQYKGYHNLYIHCPTCNNLCTHDIL